MRMLRTLIVMTAAYAMATIPVGAQQKGGDKELAFQGQVNIPFQNASDSTNGTILPRFGYYLTRRNFVGVEGLGSFSGANQTLGVNFLYRFYFGGRGSKLQPYLGAAPGYTALRMSELVQAQITPASLATVQSQIAQLPASIQAGLFTALATQEASFAAANPARKQAFTTWMPQYSGELGFKYYASQKFAFEVSYRIVYQDQSKLITDHTPWADIYLSGPVNNTYTIGTQPAKTSNIPQPQTSGGSTNKFQRYGSSEILFGFSYIF